MSSTGFKPRGREKKQLFLTMDVFSPLYFKPPQSTSITSNNRSCDAAKPQLLIVQFQAKRSVLSNNASGMGMGQGQSKNQKDGRMKKKKDNSRRNE